MQTIAINTPLGGMIAVCSTQGICLLEFADQIGLPRELAAVAAARHSFADADSDLAQRLRQQLADYFSGSLKQFDLPLDMIGTLFQQQVWRTLQGIPYGETWSYAQQAQAMNRPSAVRAVAAANGRNKISLIIPCHRVIGSNGTLTGYAGGLARKQALLALEHA